MLSFAFAACCSLVLRSGFTGHQASMILAGGETNIVLKQVLGDTAYTCMHKKQPPSMLVHNENDISHKFMHYNYTMFRCFWGSDLTVADKVEVFRSMAGWISSHNETLVANFGEADDYLAWNIAMYSDGHEHD